MTQNQLRAWRSCSAASSAWRRCGCSHLCVRMRVSAQAGACVLCAHACVPRACVRACVCARPCTCQPGHASPARGRRGCLRGLQLGLRTQGFFGFPAYAPCSVRSLFVLASDKWRAFYTRRLNEGPGDFYGC